MKPAFGDNVSAFQEMVIARLQDGNISADDLVKGIMENIPKMDVTSVWRISAAVNALLPKPTKRAKAADKPYSARDLNLKLRDMVVASTNDYKNSIG
jgi:hypothetical protein